MRRGNIAEKVETDFEKLLSVLMMDSSFLPVTREENEKHSLCHVEKMATQLKDVCIRSHTRDKTKLATFQKNVEKMSQIRLDKTVRYKVLTSRASVNPCPRFLRTESSKLLPVHTSRASVDPCPRFLRTESSKLLPVPTSCASDGLLSSYRCWEPTFGSLPVHTSCVSDERIPKIHSSRFLTFKDGVFSDKSSFCSGKCTLELQSEDNLSTMCRNNYWCCNNNFHIRHLLWRQRALGTYKDANVLGKKRTTFQESMLPDEMDSRSIELLNKALSDDLQVVPHIGHSWVEKTIILRTILKTFLCQELEIDKREITDRIEAHYCPCKTDTDSGQWTLWEDGAPDPYKVVVWSVLSLSADQSALLPVQESSPQSDTSRGDHNHTQKQNSRNCQVLVNPSRRKRRASFDQVYSRTESDTDSDTDEPLSKKAKLEVGACSEAPKSACGCSSTSIPDTTNRKMTQSAQVLKNRQILATLEVEDLIRSQSITHKKREDLRLFSWELVFDAWKNILTADTLWECPERVMFSFPNSKKSLRHLIQEVNRFTIPRSQVETQVSRHLLEPVRMDFLQYFVPIDLTISLTLKRAVVGNLTVYMDMIENQKLIALGLTRYHFRQYMTSSATTIHNLGSFVTHDCREQSGMDRLFPVSKKHSILHIASFLKELMNKNVLDVFHFGKIMTDLDIIFGLSSSQEMKSVGEAQIYYIYLVMDRKALNTLEAPQLEVPSCDDGRNGKLIKDAMEERASQRLREGNMVTISSKNNTITSMPEKDLNYTFVRSLTSLPYSQLPVPELDITVAIMQASTQAPQFPELMTILQQLADGEPVSAHVTMRYELLRVCTLKNYPKKGKIYLTLLAGAGFYYAGDEDELICYCCGVRRRNWTAQEKPRAVHVRMTPLCKFLKDNKTVNVPVPIQNHEKFSKIDAIPDLPRHELVNQQAPEDVSNDHVRAGSRTTAEAQGAQTAAASLTPAAHSSTSGAFAAQIPKYPQYATRAARLATYQGWPMETSCPRSEQLSEAGFFYAGVGDCVRCFFCGIGLRHWTEDDDPWVEHARFGKTCLYLRKKKGEEFIREIQQAYERRSNGVDVKNTSESNHPEDVMARHLLSDAAQSVLGMGYQPSIIKQGIQALISGELGDRKFSAQELMEKILDIEEAAKASASSPPTENAASTRPTSSRPPLVVGAAPVSCGVAAGNATAVDTQPTAIVSDGNKMDSKKEARKTAQTKKRETTKINFKGSNATDKMTGKQLREENERLREQSQCRVCLNNPTNTVFLPCGHLVTCTDCAAALRNCPICRTLIKGTVKTYAD